MNDQASTGAELSESDATPNGPAWAALLSASIGGAAFGFFTDVSESSPRAAKLLLWYKPAGSLSGVAICAILVWAGAWAILHGLWKGKHLQHQRALMAVTFLMILAALLATFPPFYEIFVKQG